MGTRLMLSVPPATMTSAEPQRILSAAKAMDWRPEAQKRLTVTAGTSTGSPALSAAIRATFIPCSASGMAHPMMTSSISPGFNPGARRMASEMAAAARSSGRVCLRAPFPALPTGVLTALTITASCMGLFSVIPLSF